MQSRPLPVVGRTGFLEPFFHALEMSREKRVPLLPSRLGTALNPMELMGPEVDARSRLTHPALQHEGGQNLTQPIYGGESCGTGFLALRS